MEPVDDVGRGPLAGGAVLKQLTLLRHAKSSWEHPDLDDHDRPLAPRGLRDAPLMGQRMAAHGLAPQLLLTSTAARARQTADSVRQAFAGRPLAVRQDPRLYLASPGDILAVIAEQCDDVGSLLVVGHNPGLTLFCNMLLPELRLQNLPTAGAVSIHCDAPAWAGISTAGFSLDYFAAPKLADAHGSYSTSQKQ